MLTGPSLETQKGYKSVDALLNAAFANGLSDDGTACEGWRNVGLEVLARHQIDAYGAVNVSNGTAKASPNMITYGFYA